MCIGFLTNIHYPILSSVIRADEIKAIIDRSTNDMLIRPDWEANMQCVDTVSGINSEDL